MPLDLATVHTAIGDRFPDRAAVVQGSVRRSWRQVVERTNQLANLLVSRGAGEVATRSEPWESPHQHLAIYLMNGPEYLEGVIGAHRARMAPFNVNYRYTGPELEYLFADGRPRAVLYHACFAPNLAALTERLDLDLVLIQVDDGSGEPLLPGAVEYEPALAAQSTAPPPGVVPGPSDLQIIYTGGTTGWPKGVLWRIEDMIAGPFGVRHRDGTPITDLDELLERAERAAQVVLPTPPLMHGAGLWFALGAWCAGGTVVMQTQVESLDAADIVATWAREEVEATMIVGDAFAQPLIDELARTEASLPKLTTLANSGAVLRPELKEQLHRLLPQLRIVDLLGSSETGPQAIKRDVSATFRPRANTAVVAEDRSRLLPPGDPELGWLAQTGPIPTGYLGDENKTGVTFPNIGGQRYSVTGDRVRYEPDGTITLFGRDSTTINTGGEKVFAEEVEVALRDLPSVVDAVVVGVASERWGQQVCAVVQFVPGAEITDDELREGLADKLARYKLPKMIKRVKTVRRHANGKTDYTWARTMVTGEGT
jgi:3-oxocholest-4-en-26-oate---CoA ligase